ncbi:amidohydrolase family protein [Hymenobacter coccineus]|uniref:amidohydrolase family protein n=1 Tax=Hymenobacter coccineus TaxID=1908235 RepID=UPI0009F4714A|nr:amidohydrolase family protein [Hymenobacter coccineus]
MACQANDRLAAAIQAHPDRFTGFATLPTPDPVAAVSELHRAVQELGLRGAMIHARTGDGYLDHPDYRPLLAAAAALEVPVYLHPQIPPQPVRAQY